MNNAAVFMNYVLRLRPEPLREGNRLWAAALIIVYGRSIAARYRWEG